MPQKPTITIAKFRLHPSFLGRALAGEFGPVIQRAVEEDLRDTQEDITYVRGTLLELYEFGPVAQQTVEDPRDAQEDIRGTLLELY